MSGAGKINSDWFDEAMCCVTRDEVIQWFCTATNSANVEIDSDLCVSVDNKWLSQDRIDELCQRIDAGV